VDRLRSHLAAGLPALALLAVGLAGTGPAGRVQGVPVDARAYVLVAGVALVLVVRRRWPRAVLAAVTLATSAYLVLGYPYGPILAGFAVAVYTVAVRRPVRPAALAAGLALPVLLAHVAVGGGPLPGVDGVLPGSAWVVVPFAVGVTVRVSREAAARAREDEARRQADGERLRVAQEVHDVVGHGLAAINMQAEIALHLLPRRPEQAEAALAAISRTSKEALDELRATLSVVRRGGGADDRAPGPGLARLDDLLARTRGVGVPVSVEVTGGRPELPGVVDLTAYRIVQESLTNVLRHAGAASVTVRLGYEPRRLHVEVVDTGRGGAPGGVGGPGGDVGSDGDVGGAGHGIAGMRERVEALGGTFAAGPVAGGGFRVAATLPVRP
jgi:signal transduction histidine kinase